jgi:imidazolonepropionase-like amidohydrolase
MAAAEPALVFKGVTVVDAERVVENATVVLQGDRITAVGTRVRIPKDARVIEGQGKYLIPGLIDAHVHFFQSGGLYTRPDGLDLRSVKPYADELAETKAALGSNFRRYLRSGITTVLDIGGPRWNFEVRAKAASEPLAPRVFVAGPLVSTVSRPQLDLGDPPIIKAASPDEARALVRAQAADKPDYIKIWYVALTPGDAEKNFPVVKAAADEAHTLGIPVAIHATELETARKAVEAGADLLVHGVFDKPVDAAFLRALKARGVIYCPTPSVIEGYQETARQRIRFTPAEWVWADARVLNTLTDLPLLPGGLLSPERLKLMQERPALPENSIGLKNLKAVWDAGIPVAAGSDAGNPGTPHGPGLYRDFELMNEAGLSPREVLKAATAGGAKAVRQKNLGLVKEGYLADLALLDADPRESVRNFGQIVGVVNRGTYREPRELLPLTASDVVWRQVLAYNARDAEVFAATYSENVVIHRGDQEMLRGREALKKSYAEMFAKYPLSRARITEEIVEGGAVIHHEEVYGRGPETIRAIAIYEVKGGLIERVWFPVKN